MRTSEKRIVFDMPRRPARVTQADISRAIRAAKESGAGESVIEFQIDGPAGTITSRWGQNLMKPTEKS